MMAQQDPNRPTRCDLHAVAAEGRALFRRFWPRAAAFAALVLLASAAPLAVPAEAPGGGGAAYAQQGEGSRSYRRGERRQRGTRRETPARAAGAATTGAIGQGDGGVAAVGVISGDVNGTYARIASEMAAVLDDGDTLRVLPIIGKGSVQNIRDLNTLRGVDVALVQGDVFETMRQSTPGIERRISYIARLYNNEIHIVARGDLRDARDLAGKTVNFDVVGSGTAATAAVVFERLGVKVNVANFDQALGLEKLRRGEVDAVIFNGGRPVRGVSEFRGEGFKLLPIPFARELEDLYLPATFTSADYPNLIPAGQSVETLGVPNVLAVFNWPDGSDRYRRLERFTQAFFGKFETFLTAPRHPKWREVNLAATIPGWQRFAPAQRVLDAQVAAASRGVSRSDFDRFLQSQAGAGAANDNERERLFEQFLEWQRQRPR